MTVLAANFVRAEPETTLRVLSSSRRDGGQKKDRAKRSPRYGGLPPEKRRRPGPSGRNCVALKIDVVINSGVAVRDVASGFGVHARKRP